MVNFSRTMVKAGVIGALGLGGLLVVAGPDRISALFRQAQDSINDKIDEHITDPVALRAQLKNLEAQYPKRIEQVRGDLAQVRAHVAQLRREREVSERVVALTESDLGLLRSAMTQVQEATVVNASLTEPTAIRVQFNDQLLTVDETMSRAAEVNSTREHHLGRIADLHRDLGHLEKQEQRLAAMLTKLQAEASEFRVQLGQLDRQVDSIARNERMISVLKSREEAINEQSRYRAASLDGLTGRLAEIRARQEGELASLGQHADRTDYETRAKVAIDRDAGKGILTTPPTGGTDAAKPAAPRQEPAAGKTLVIKPRATPPPPAAATAEADPGPQPGQVSPGATPVAGRN